MDSKSLSFANLTGVCVKDHKNSDEFSLSYFCLGFYVSGGLSRGWLLQCHYRFSARVVLANDLRCNFAADCKTSHQASTESIDIVTKRLQLIMPDTKAEWKSAVCWTRGLWERAMCANCSDLVIPIILFIGHSNVSVSTTSPTKAINVNKHCKRGL